MAVELIPESILQVSPERVYHNPHLPSSHIRFLDTPYKVSTLYAMSIRNNECILFQAFKRVGNLFIETKVVFSLHDASPLFRTAQMIRSCLFAYFQSFSMKDMGPLIWQYVNWEEEAHAIVQGVIHLSSKDEDLLQDTLQSNLFLRDFFVTKRGLIPIASVKHFWEHQEVTAQFTMNFRKVTPPLIPESLATVDEDDVVTQCQTRFTTGNPLFMHTSRGNIPIMDLLYSMPVRGGTCVLFQAFEQIRTIMCDRRALFRIREHSSLEGLVKSQNAIASMLHPLFPKPHQTLIFGYFGNVYSCIHDWMMDCLQKSPLPNSRFTTPLTWPNFLRRFPRSNDLFPIAANTRTNEGPHADLHCEQLEPITEPKDMFIFDVQKLTALLF